MEMKVYFVRHGQTEFNAQNQYQPLDSSLSQKGIEQAQFVAKRLTDIQINVVLSSNLKRAIQTAEIINEKLQKEHIQIKELREAKRPSIFIGKNKADQFVMDVMSLTEEHADDPSWHYSDEENFSDVKSRAIKALQIIASRSEDHILVVTHGEFLRFILGILLIGESLTFLEYKHIQNVLKTTNTGITVCYYEKTEWKLLTWNDHAHLP